MGEEREITTGELINQFPNAKIIDYERKEIWIIKDNLIKVIPLSKKEE